MMESWVIQLLSVFTVVLGVDFLQRFLLRRIRLRLESTNKVWKDAALAALRAPASLLIWTGGLMLALGIVEKEQKIASLPYLIPFCHIAVTAILTWFSLRFISQVGDKLVLPKRSKNSFFDRTTFDAIGKLVRIFILVIATLATLQHLGFSISGVLAFGGVSGIALGFAAKDLLANLFGSFTIYWDRPFAIGDWIRSPDREIEGIVEQIGWRITQIRTLDKRPLYVPNSIFTSIIVENPSRMSHRKIVETMGIRYKDLKAINPILEEIKALFRQDPEIDSNQICFARVDALSASSVDLLIQAYILTIDQAGFQKVKESLLLKIHQIIHSHGAEIARPSTDFYLHPQKTESHLHPKRLTQQVESPFKV